MIKENLVKVFEKSIHDHWDLPALSDYRTNDLTYGQVAEKIAKIHLIFEQCGIKPGNKIALIGRNSANWAITYLSVVTYGATIVPILADFHPNDIQNIINHSDSVMLFIGENIAGSINSDKMPALRAIIGLADYKVIMERDEYNVAAVCDAIDVLFAKRFPDGLSTNNFSLPEVPNSNIGVISYTSGTTGFSKGVMLTMQSLLANIHYAWHNMPLKANDNILCILPLAHAYGCAFEFLWPFTIGVHITFLGKIVSPQAMIEAFKEVKPDLLLMVPLIMEKIYKKQILPAISKPVIKVILHIPLINRIIYNKIRASLTEVFGGNFKEVVIGGAALNKDVERFLRNIKFNFSVGYGMTECGPLISYANWDKTRISSAGRLVDSLEMAIDSPDPENQPGEILVRGENVMIGYYKNPEATLKTIDTEGWFHTGDLGVMDRKGFVFIRGRSKSMILGPSGENIYPEEIEAKLNSFPFVQEQLVISHQNKLVALVYPDMDMMKREGLAVADLELIMEKNKKDLNELLPKFMHISKIKLHFEEFQKTPKQSIKRFLYESVEN
jgi:long-chain acyl-CoA synthetase